MKNNKKFHCTKCNKKFETFKGMAIHSKKERNTIMKYPPMSEVPLKKVQALPVKEREIFIKIIRELLKANNMYLRFHKGGLGIDESEEAVIELINKGYVKIVLCQETETFHMELWNGEKYITGDENVD